MPESTRGQRRAPAADGCGELGARPWAPGGGGRVRGRRVRRTGTQGRADSVASGAMEHSEPRTDDAGRRRPVTILAIADEERDALTIPGAVDFGPGNRPDLLLSAGDLNYKYVTAVADAFNVPCVMVPGNHDPSLEGFTLTAAGWLRAGRHDTWPGPEGAWNADRDVVEVAGIRIAGLGGCGKYSSGPNQWSDGEAMRRAKRTLRRARKGHDGERGERLADVLLTHAPGTVGAGTDNAHRALPAVDLLVERLCPALHLHGHVHLHGAERPVTEIPAGGECRDGTNGDVANGAGTNGAGVNLSLIHI